jgi:hypothetical protein
MQYATGSISTGLWGHCMPWLLREDFSSFSVMLLYWKIIPRSEMSWNVINTRETIIKRVCVGWKASADLEMYMHHFCFCRVEGLVSALLVPLCQSERTEEGGLADVIRADRPMPRSLLPAAPCVIAEYQGGSMAKIKE